MQTLGQKLEEARTKKGISIREASESIKVRSDFLLHFENNEFNFNLNNMTRLINKEVKVNARPLVLSMAREIDRLLKEHEFNE